LIKIDGSLHLKQGNILEYFIIVHNLKEIMQTDLNVYKPLLQALYTSLTVNDIPHNQVERPWRQEVLVCCVVFPLQNK
jgi:hypothetical protein